MKDKKRILEAITSFDTYNESTRSVLRTLVATSTIDNRANISITSLSNLAEMSRQAVYNALRNLERVGAVTRSKSSGQSSTNFTIDPSYIDKIIERHDSLSYAKKLLG